WVGGESSVLVCLAKYRASKYLNKNQELLRNLTSNLYISYDYGTTFVKIDSLKLLDGDSNTGSSNASIAANSSSDRPLLNNFYISEIQNTNFIFTDVLHNHLFITHDYGRNFIAVRT